MRRSLWLVAAAAWLLLLGACGDQPPAKEPRSVRSPHRMDGDPRVDADASGRSRPSTQENLRGFSQPDVALTSPSSEQLAQRYARARVLAVQQGSASYYADAFAGRNTASGTPYQPHAFTAAHRNLPFGTILRVTRTDGGQSVYVRVTDRGPFGPRGRILDLSRAAAERLGMLRAGVVKVKAEVVEYGPPRKSRRRRR